MKQEKVIVGMSGGVDSSVAAWLLQTQGYQVEGLFMKNWEQDDTETYCAAEADLADARAVCHQLGIPLHTINFSQTYWDKVFTHFLQEYRAGRTPNPDILCNKEIKFKAFFDHAQTLGADWIATGHYARADQGKLLKAKDREKDQTYFLHAIDPQVLHKTLFPVGDYLKSEIRDLAKQAGLVTHTKKDSTGICFIGERRFRLFLQEFLLTQPGPIVSTDGKQLGEHQGLMYHTIGQRQGLGIGGGHSTNNAPWYVVDKDIAHNTLIVAQGSNHSMLYAQGLTTSSIHWLTPAPLELPWNGYAKIRYRQAEQACMVSPADENKHHVVFATPQRAITPGQYIVLYEKNQCLGGAVIEHILK